MASKNEGTKNQIRVWLENAVKNAQNPDLREINKQNREKRSKNVAKTYGL